MAGCLDFPMIHEEASTIAQRIVSDTLSSKPFMASKIQGWSDMIMDKCVKGLVELSPNFKYVVTAVIFQKNKAGVHSHTTAYWDAQTDTSFTVRWENESLACIVTVFGLAI